MKFIITTICNDIKNYKLYIISAFLLFSIFLNYELYHTVNKQGKYLDLGSETLDSCNKECDYWSKKYFEAKRENNLLIDSCLKEILKLKTK